jgi:hypothetical protein
MLFRAAILLATLLIPFAGSAAAEPARPAAPKTTATLRLPPMIFYLAKGENGACGTDCNEWIAAEGQIETGSAQQLRTFLTRLGKRRLPIFFHSPGGNVTASMAMGRLLRERDMTAGVSETVPVGCVGTSEQACRALKQSGFVLPATLRNVSACNSACVFALIGAKDRYVPPGARLGVHSSKVVIFRLDGGKLNASSKQVASLQRTRLAELNVDTRRYVQEMKVDVRLFDLAAKIPHEDVHYLTREEIVGFGIDLRGASEARWIAAEVMPQRLWTMKFFVETSGDGKNELRSNMIRMECVSQRYAKLAYFRGIGSDASGLRRKFELSMAERRIPLSGGLFFKVDAIESGTSFELWSAELPLDLIEAASARDHVEIREIDPARETARVTRLSTVGLPQAVGMLRNRCKSMPDCPPVSAGAVVGNGAAPQSGWAAGAMLPKAGTSSSNWSGDTGSLNCAAMQVQ